ncbi:hypothetical protein GGS24DRAFT_513273 [Hypoxylon argillaceum]|nr:hypothetical protein GGS24DRAFT_513273 [Hypoxylon argillaceum]
MSIKTTIVLLATALSTMASPFARAPPADLQLKVIEGASGTLDALELPQFEEALDLFQDRLGTVAPRKLLTQDIAEGDAFWHDILSKTTGEFVGVTMRAQGYAPHEVSDQQRWPRPILRTSPEHYYVLVAPGVADPKDTLEFVESWGPSLRIYYATRNEPKPSFLPALEAFPAEAQITTALVLGDGTIFAHGLTAWRDLPGNDGVEIFEGVWIPENVPAEIMDGLEAHITVAFQNWMKLAYQQAIGA